MEVLQTSFSPKAIPESWRSWNFCLLLVSSASGLAEWSEDRELSEEGARSFFTRTTSFLALSVFLAFFSSFTGFLESSGLRSPLIRLPPMAKGHEAVSSTHDFFRLPVQEAGARDLRIAQHASYEQNHLDTRRCKNRKMSHGFDLLTAHARRESHIAPSTNLTGDQPQRQHHSWQISHNVAQATLAVSQSDKLNTLWYLPIPM